MDALFQEMLAKFEDLAERAKEAKVYECEFNCLNVIMGIRSNLKEAELQVELRQAQIKEQLDNAVKAKK